MSGAVGQVEFLFGDIAASDCEAVVNPCNSGFLLVHGYLTQSTQGAGRDAAVEALAATLLFGLEPIERFFRQPTMKALRDLTVKASADKWRARFVVYTPGVFACGLLVAALASHSLRTWAGTIGYALLGYTLISLTAVVAAGQGAGRRAKALDRREWLLFGQLLVSIILSVVVLADGIKQFL